METLRNAWKSGGCATRAVIAFIGLALLACFGFLTCTIADTALRSADVLPTSTPSATATRTPTVTPSVTPSATPTAIPSPTPAATATPTATRTPLPTATADLTPTAEAAVDPTPTTEAADVAAPTLAPTVTPAAAVSAGDVIEVHFIDVGQGDAILVRGAGAAVLIDGGDRGSGVVAYLRGMGVQHLDAVVATHPHADHIGGLTEVIQALPVEQVITNGQPHTTLTYERFLDAIIAAQVDYREVTRGEQIRAGGLTFHVLHPISPTGSNLNEQSVVLRLDHHHVSVLLTGDIESGSEASLATSGQRLRAQILKAPHHGSKSSSTSGFLQQVRPEVAIYCAAASNRYGHPRPEALARLEAVGATIYGTDVHGTVVVTTDGQTYQVTTGRSGEISAPAAPTPVPATATSAPPPPTPEPAPATPEPVPPTATSEPEPPPVVGCPYIGNRNSGVFHKASCHHVNRMAEHNKVCIQTREEAIAQGYRACKVCKP